ncbi:type IV pilus assembly protein PilN [Neobacillus bataviensis]|uniref:Type IV pilus assembly protein PilN n=1 Tax=Neobacillus bataviensis TaxID=220685 RepID=A0A561DGP2_9BACI|nr:PilN domain-containing protein [Neobacillus bataviensis]TWE02554.1 type IV pilus assembly protein PilN [Neobacillus bataviensis]
MLVEINLLPQKEPKKLNIVYLSAIAAVLILVGGVYFWQIKSVKSDVESVDQQITMTKKNTEKEQQSAQTNEVSTSVVLLKSAVDWADAYPIQTIPVMRHLNSLLPERGFIQSFAYSETGTVTISVQFDSTREAAYFLESLIESEWIEDASLNSLTANESEETTDSATQSTSQNTASGTTGQTTTSTTNTASTAQDTTAAVTNSEITTSGQTNQSNKSGTTTNQSNSNSTSTGVAANGTTTAKPDNNILPRYVGQFEITFNKEAIKESTDESKENEEGVTAP